MSDIWVVMERTESGWRPFAATERVASFSKKKECDGFRKALKEIDKKLVLRSVKYQTVEGQI